jgi:ribosome-associated toxin RatA of RatAB toxin-antitoxin module
MLMHEFLDAACRERVTMMAVALPDQARGFVITDAATYQRVCEFAVGIKALRLEIAETLDPHIRRAFEAHRELCAEKKRAEADAILAERIVKDLIVAWDVAQEQQRTAERLRLDAEARAVVTEAVIERAAAAEAAGDLGAAAAILDEPIIVPTSSVPTPPRPAGLASRVTWRAQVTDLLALVRYVAANPQYLPLLQPNTKTLDQQARSLQARLALPGVQAVGTRDVAIRATR